MSWIEIYRSRITSAEEALESVQSGQRLFLTGNCSVPQTLLSALVDRAENLEDVEIVQALTVGPAPQVAPEMEGHLRVNTLFISGNVRGAVQEGRADFTPVFLSEIPSLFQTGTLPLDVALIHVAPPDEHGFCSLGIEAGLIKTPAQSAKIVIAEVNERMPRTLGDSFIHVSKITHAVPVDYPLLELPMGETNELSRQIGEHIASLIEDGSTMQMGIGGIPDAVLDFLEDKRDLGVHTELFSDGVMELVGKGVITNERKSLHPGKIVAGFLLGTKRLYDFVDDNPIVGNQFVNTLAAGRHDRQSASHCLQHRIAHAFLDTGTHEDIMPTIDLRHLPTIHPAGQRDRIAKPFLPHGLAKLRLQGAPANDRQ